MKLMRIKTIPLRIKLTLVCLESFTSNHTNIHTFYIAGILCSFVADSIFCTLSNIIMCVSIISSVATIFAMWSNNKSLPLTKKLLLTKIFQYDFILYQ